MDKVHPLLLLAPGKARSLMIASYKSPLKLKGQLANQNCCVCCVNSERITTFHCLY